MGSGVAELRMVDTRPCIRDAMRSAFLPADYEGASCMRDPIEEVMNYNRPLAQRSPELLRLKVAHMAESAFPFFRRTFHLYALDVMERRNISLPLLSGGGAEMDLVGDLHCGNYCTFEAAGGAG